MTSNENYGTTDAHHEKTMNINENRGNIHEDHGQMDEPHTTKLNTSKKSDEHHSDIDENNGKFNEHPSKPWKY